MTSNKTQTRNQSSKRKRMHKAPADQAQLYGQHTDRHLDLFTPPGQRYPCKPRRDYSGLYIEYDQPSTETHTQKSTAGLLLVQSRIHRKIPTKNSHEKFPQIAPRLLIVGM